MFFPIHKSLFVLCFYFLVQTNSTDFKESNVDGDYSRTEAFQLSPSNDRETFMSTEVDLKHPLSSWESSVTKTVITSLSFTMEPPYKFFFANTETGRIDCAANSSSPSSRVKIKWKTHDGKDVENIPNVRLVKSDGRLVFFPFSTDSFDPKVHRNVYFCLASNEFGSIVSRDVNVRGVIRRTPVIHVHDQHIISGGLGIMVCRISNYEPELMKLRDWIEEPTGRIIKPMSGHLTDDEPLTSLNRSRFLISNDGNLFIRQVDRSFQDRRYRCRVTSTLTRQVFTSSSAGRLIIGGPADSVPPRIDFRGQDQYSIHLHGQAIIPCPLVNADTASNLIWLRNDDTSQSIDVHDGRIKALSEFLIVNDAKLNDSGVYICSTNSSIGTAKFAMRLVVMTRIEVRLKKILPTTGATNSRNLHRLALNCIISGGPISSIVWKKDGKPIEGNNYNFVNNNLLAIKRIGKKEQGFYQCFASNEEQSASDSIYVEIDVFKVRIKSASQSNIYTQGEKIHLTCEIYGQPLASVYWSLDGSIISNSSHHRIIITEADTKDFLLVSSLTILKATLLDAGEYQCLAKYGTTKINQRKKVLIKGLPLVKSIQDQILVSGQQFRLDCPVIGHPIDSIKWLKDGVQLKTNSRSSIYENGTLLIERVEKLLDEGKYSCEARRNDHISESRFFLSVRVKPSIEPFSFPRGLQVSQRATLSCTVVTGDYPMIIKWLKDGEPIKGGSNPRLLKVSDYSISLVFESLSSSHRGNYSCEAHNVVGHANYLAILDINELPRWLLEPNDLWAVQGHKVILHCQANGNPSPRIRWSKAKHDLAQGFKGIISNPHVQVHENGSLIIHEADRSDTGFYSCQAHNGVGPGLSKVIKLDIFAGAHFYSHYEEKIVAINESIVLKCVSSGEEPLEILWTMDGQKIFSSDGNFKAQSFDRYTLSELRQNMILDSRLSIQQAQPQDSANFICRTSNPFGTDEKKILLIVQEPPQPPTNVHAEKIGPYYATLKWQSPSDGNSPISNYLVEYKSKGLQDNTDYERIETSVIVGNQTRTTVSSLKPFSRYEFRISAENAIGRSRPSEILSITTSEDVPTEGPKNVRAYALSSYSVKVSWSPPDPIRTNGLVRGYLITCRSITPDFNNYSGSLIINVTNPNINELKLKDLARLSRYLITVQVYNSIGTSPESDGYQVTTFGIDLPHRPMVNVVLVTGNSVDFSWIQKSDSNRPVEGFYIYQKKDAPIHNESFATKGWKKFSMSSETRFYRSDNLECASKYYFLISAFNAMGEGPSSEVKEVTTHGSTPTVAKPERLIQVKGNEILVSFKPWQTDGCPILEYSLKWLSVKGDHSEWVPLAANKIFNGEENLSLEVRRDERIEKLQIQVRNRLGTSKSEYALPIKVSDENRGRMSLYKGRFKSTRSNSSLKIDEIGFKDIKTPKFNAYVAWLTFAWILPILIVVVVKYLRHGRHVANGHKNQKETDCLGNKGCTEKHCAKESIRSKSPVNCRMLPKLEPRKDDYTYTTLLKKTRTKSVAFTESHAHTQNECGINKFSSLPNRPVQV